MQGAYVGSRIHKEMSRMNGHSTPIDLYSTCPQSKDYVSGHEYLGAVTRTARWSDAQGCKGMLIYTDNSLVDPWLLAQRVLECTEHLTPLVAVQPAYMHPYSVAKMVTSLSFLHGRSMALNLVAGGFQNDLAAMGDVTPHDDRYARITEYGSIVMGLLRGESVTLDGAHYQVKRLKLMPKLPEELSPVVLMSGSSPAALDTARAIGATAIRYPQDPEKEQTTVERPEGVQMGLRVGIVARDEAESAWTEAEARFPVDRQGQIMHALAMRTSDSHWHKQLSKDAAESANGDGDAAARSPYWLHPFQQYQTFCPYLVGSYERVADELAQYFTTGDRALIVDIPQEEDDLVHANRVLALVGTGSAPLSRALA
jgi:alkanesulfonate monooxygenase